MDRTRKVERRNYSLHPDAVDAIESYARAHSISKSKVVQLAVLEYTGHDRTKRIEEKLDQLLEYFDEGAPAEYAEKEKENRPTGSTQSTHDTSSSSNTSEITKTYDHTEEHDDPLTTDEIRILLEQDEPHINSDHIGTLPRSSKEKAALVAAVLRSKSSFDQATRIITTDDVENTVEELVGDSQHIMQTYPQKVMNELIPKEEPDPSNSKKMTKSDEVAFPTQEAKRLQYKTILETDLSMIKEPDSVDGIKNGKQNIERYRRIYIESGAATEDEIDQYLELARDQLQQIDDQ